jgi:hypothetical protein
MSRFTKEQLHEILARPNYTLGHAAYHAYTKGEASGTEPESAVCDEPLAAEKGKAGYAASYIVRVISYRRRLLDEDNLCPKHAIDALRYCGWLPSDAPDKCHIETRQVKVKGKENEFTELTIERYET